MRELALFAGAGGGILGGRLLGWRTVCAVEIDPYARRVLLARQADGCLDRFPIWDDVRTFDGTRWRGTVDIISGGFPCQDISVAGRGAGIDGAKSGLWVEMARIIREVGPRFVFVENSAALTGRGLGRVLGDLAAMGYDARWGVFGAQAAGAPHKKRDRIWIVADSHGHWKPQPQGSEQEQRGWFGDCREMGDPYVPRSKGQERSQKRAECSWFGVPHAASWWDAEPDVGRVANGVAHRVDRLRALGNGQVPAVAALAWRMLSADPSGYPDN